MTLEPLGLGVTSRFSRDPCLLASLMPFRSSQDFVLGAARVEGQFLWLDQDLVLGKGECEPLCSWPYPRSFLTYFLLHSESVTLAVGQQCHSHLSLSELYHFEIMSLILASFFPKPSETGPSKHWPSVSYFILMILDTTWCSEAACFWMYLIDVSTRHLVLVSHNSNIQATFNLLFSIPPFNV